MPQLLRLLAELAELHGNGGSRAVLEQEPSLLHLLDLIPDAMLLRTTGPRQLAQRLRRNRELRERLRSLRPADRVRLVELAIAGSPDERRVAEAALRYARSGVPEDLAGADYELLRKMLRATPAATDEGEEADGGEPPRRRVVRTVLADQLAIECLFGGQPGDAIGTLEQVRRVLEDEVEDDVIRRGDEMVRPRPRSGRTEAIAIAESLISEEVWGGFIEARGTEDPLLALRQLEEDEIRVVPFHPEARDWPAEMLLRAVRMGYAQSRASEAWENYKRRRAKIVPHRHGLSEYPLLYLAAQEALREDARALLEAYRHLMMAVQETAQSLGEAGAPEAGQRLIARTLALDLVFLLTGRVFDAVCGPTHPFHLWHWLTLYDLISAERERWAGEVELLEEAVRMPPPTAPHVLLSPFVISHLEHPRALIANGRIGALPRFSEPGARLYGPDGSRAFAALAERFVRLQPHAGRGLRIAVVDPPVLSEFVKGLLGLEGALEPDGPIPVHVRVYRTRRAPEPPEEEQDALDGVSAELAEHGGSLQFEGALKSPEEVAEDLRRRPAHVTAIFDPGAARDLTVNVVEPPALSPLVLPRVYRYNAFDDRIDAVPAGTGGPFGAYHELFCSLLARPTTDFVGRRSGAAQYAEGLARLAEHTSWLVVLDRGLEPTLQIGGCARLDTRSDGARDVAVFTHRPEAVRDLVAEALEAAGIVPHELLVQQAIEGLARLGGEGVLALLRPGGRSNFGDPRRAKGLIGILRAGRWYSERYPDGLLLSLDHPAARPWLVGEDEARRADLIGIRSTPDGLVVDVMEVKTDDAAADACRLDRQRIEGTAVRQIEATIDTMRRVMRAGQAPTLDSARREVLRDCFYRAVASRALEPDQRRRYFGMLEELFREGPKSFVGILVKATIQNAVGPAERVHPVTYRSPEGVEITLVELVEGGRPGGAPDGNERGAVVRPEETRVASPGGEERQGQGPEEENIGWPEAAERTGDQRLRFFIGRDLSGSDVFWDPDRGEQPLRNFGFQVTGSSGSGKTQLLRALLAESASSRLPVLVLDFKNDYSERLFTGSAGLRVHDVARDGLPFNPLALVPDGTDLVRPGYAAFEVAALLKRVFRLGEQQEAALRNAIRDAYRTVGIPDAATPLRASGLPDAPGFGAVVQLLRASPSNTALLNRVEPLFDLGIFPENDAVAATFEELLEGRTVLSLNALPNDWIRSVVAEFLIMRMHGHLLRGAQPRRLTRLIVLDEAHRVAESERLSSLAREGRAFGVGLVIATQFAKDIPDTISGNLETKVFFKASAEDAQAVARTITGNAAGQEARRIIELALNLEQYRALVANQHYAPYVVVNTVPFFRRVLGGGAE
ncbi:MAG TPA: ATP-binding protein [Gemmatimonadales bacterium]|nr:ATP-binding protein [Gemmatimonadales bacterium]